MVARAANVIYLAPLTKATQTTQRAIIVLPNARCGDVMDDHLSFGAWLKRRRYLLGLTQDELARQVGYSVSLIQKVEADERRPSRQMVERLTGQLTVEDD